MNRIDDPRFVDKLNLIQVVLWVLLALLILPAQSYFLFDEAYIYSQAMKVASLESFPVFGTYIIGTDAPTFVPGGWIYIIFAIPLMIWNSPAVLPIFFILYSSAAIITFDSVLKRFDSRGLFRVIVVTMLTWSIWHAESSSRIWNPHIFWGTTIFLVSIIFNVVSSRKAGYWSGLAFGLLCGLEVQAHLPGVVAVMASVLVLLSYVKKIEFLGRFVVASCVGMVLMFLPYLIAEIGSNFSNTLNLTRGAPGGTASYKTLRLAIEAPFFYGSQAESFKAAFNPKAGHYWGLASGVLSTVFVLAALFRQSVWRSLGIAVWVMLPLFMSLTHRNFFHHYVYSVVPIIIVLTASGAAAVASRSPLFQKLVLLATAMFWLMGAWSLCERVANDVGIQTSGDVVKRLTELETPLYIENFGEDEYFMAVVSKYMLDKTLPIYSQLSGEKCELVDGEAILGSGCKITRDQFYCFVCKGASSLEN